jgi:hypothetical protein
MSTLSHLGPRLVFVAVALGLWFWTQRLVSAKAPVKNGVGDRLHDGRLRSTRGSSPGRGPRISP